MSAKMDKISSRGVARPSDFGGVSKKLRSPSFYQWVSPTVTDNDLENILKADSESAKLGILDDIFSRATLPDSFMSDSYRNERVEFLRKLEFDAAQSFPDLVSDGVLAKMRIQRRKRKPISRIKKEAIKRVKVIQIEQRSSTGKKYKRSYQRWSKSEELYLKVRANRISTGKESFESTSKGLSSLTGNMRSNSSIKRKLGRL